MTYDEALASSSKIVLTSDGTTVMDDIIKNAIKNYSVIIFDGSDNTDFWLNQYIAFDGLKNKTLIGVNGARLCTKFYLTPEIHQMLNNYQWTTTTGTQKTGVKAGSTSSGSNKFGNLPNGQSVGEESEYLTRKALIEYLSDNDENFRKAGVFQFKNCENFIIRNLKFVGPGPCDVGGYDLMSMSTSSHFWVDHCEFTDGIDGNFDITNNSDFSTISWCTFAYTERAYAHMNTNLVGSSDTDGVNNNGDNYLNLTFAYNHWGSGCDQRMPMARAGKIHMLNNYYTCKNNSSSINPRANSEFYIEGNYFADGVTKVFSQSGAKAYQWISSGSGANVIASSGVSAPSSSGTVTIPYTYDNTLTAANVPTEVGKWAGATLFKQPLAPTATVSVSKTEVKKGASVVLTAETNGNPEPTIQWYSCSNEQKANAQAISGATDNTYSPSTTTIGGPYYYYAQVTNSQGSATSNVVSFSVVENSDVVWTFTDATTGEFANNSSGAALSVTGSDGSVLGYYSNTGSNSKITEASATISDIQYTKSLNMGGAGSTNNRYFLTPELSGKGTLTIVYAGTASGTCSIYKNGESSAITTISPVTSTAVTSTEIDLSSEASALKIVHSAKCYIYAIIWTLTGTTPPATKQPVTLAFKNDFKAKVGTEINVSDIVAVTSNGTDISDKITPTLVSSKEAIASIANGKMTVKAKGTFTLTASFEGNGSFEAADQITRTVIAYSDEDGEEVESISGSGTVWGAEQTENVDGSKKTSSKDVEINNMTSFTIASTYNPSGDCSRYSGAPGSNAGLKLRTGSGKLVLNVKNGYKINEVSVYGYSNYAGTELIATAVKTDGGEINYLSQSVTLPAKSSTLTGNNFTVTGLNATESVELYFTNHDISDTNTGTQGAFWFIVKYQKQEPASSIQCVKLVMNKYGRASFSSSYDIDFSDIEGLATYTGDHINDANGNLVLEPFTGILKAGEGVLLRGTENETYYLPISSSAGMVPSLNLLHGLKPGDLIYASTDLLHNYKFGVQSGNVGFYNVAIDYMTGSYGAYLSINGGVSNAAPAAYLLEFDENGATGIAIMENPQNTKTDVRYNISGQRVYSNYRGITIVNGRKVVRK